MIDGIILAVAITTPPLSFISIDCTQYGSVENPALIMSHHGMSMVGDLKELENYPRAKAFLKIIEAGDHERWADPKCKIKDA